MYAENGDTIRKWNSTFQISVDGCAWSIQVVPGSGYPGKRSFSEIIAESDGTNVFHSTIINRQVDNTELYESEVKKFDELIAIAETNRPADVSKLLRMRNTLATNAAMSRLAKETKTPIETMNDAIGEALPQNYPRSDHYLLPVIWLAYGSSCYFESQNDRKLPDIFLRIPGVDKRPQDTRLKADWQTSNSSIAIPNRVVMWNAGTYLANDENRLVEMPFHKPYHAGFTNSVFEVISTTNLNDVTLPNSFRITRFSPLRNARSNKELRIASVIECAAESISPLPQDFTVKPTLTHRTIVNDYRLPEVNEYRINGATYHSGPGLWPSIKEVRRMVESSPVMKGAMTNAQNVNNRKKRSRAIFLTILILPTAALFWSIYVYRRPQATPPPQT